jgi:hypothetical protein
LKFTGTETGAWTVPLAETDESTTPRVAVAVRTLAAVGVDFGPTTRYAAAAPATTTTASPAFSARVRFALRTGKRSVAVLIPSGGG